MEIKCVYNLNTINKACLKPDYNFMRGWKVLNIFIVCKYIAHEWMEAFFLNSLLLTSAGHVPTCLKSAFGPNKMGLCFALCLAQVQINTDSWASLVQIRSNFAFLVLYHLIFIDNLSLVLIFHPLTCNCHLGRNRPCIAQNLHIQFCKSAPLLLNCLCQFSKTQFNLLLPTSESEADSESQKWYDSVMQLSSFPAVDWQQLPTASF